MSSLREQVSSLQMEIHEERSRHKSQEDELRGKIEGYEEQVDDLLNELREKNDELKAVEADLEVRQSQLKVRRLNCILITN